MSKIHSKRRWRNVRVGGLFGFKTSRRAWNGRQRVIAGALAIVILAGIIIPVILLNKKAEAATWWNSGNWGYRRQVTLDNSASSEMLYNFSVRVSLSSSNINYSNTQNSGQDLRFVDPDGTVLNYDIEKWDEAGTSEVWVNVPVIDAGSTTDFFWMYYGNASAPAGKTPKSTWGNDYKAVYHMNQDPTTTSCFANKSLCDSTANANGGSPNGSMTSGDLVSAKIDGGIDFDGTNDNYAVADSDSLDMTSNVTLSAWVYRASNPGTYQTIMIKEDSTTSANYALQLDGSNLLDFSLVSGGSYWESKSATALSSTNTWYHVAATYSDADNTVKLYINGVLNATRTETHSMTPNSESLMIGDSRPASSVPWVGKLDELRVSSANKSANWIKAEYVSGNNAMTSFGSEQSGTYHPEGSWAYRRKVTFNNSPSSSNLTNFPVRIDLDSSRIDYSILQDAGQDIRFVDSDDTTLLNYEAENWTKNGKSTLWVNVPQVNSGSKTDYIWMYYGNGYVTDGQNQSGAVWDSNNNLVYHMADSGALLADATSNTKATSKLSSGRPSVSALGQIAKSQDFDGTNDYAYAPSPSLPTGDFTYNVWVKLDTTTGTILESTDSSATAVFKMSVSSGVLTVALTGASNSGFENPLAAGKWYNLAVTRSGSTVRVYNNGVVYATALSSATTLNFSTCGLLLGVDPDSGCNGTLNAYMNGNMDELRVSSTARSADWINAEYRNGIDSFSSYGPQQLNTSAPGGNWLDSCFAYRRKITFSNSNSAENLVNFPVRVSLTSANVDYSKTQNSGQDIRFTDSNGVRQLSHQIEVWDESGTSEVWVRVPQIDAASATDFIWMYYGCGSASDGQDPHAVWNNDFRGVWHMNGTSSTEADSTSYAANGSVVGSPTRGATGKIGKAYDFPGTSGNYVNAGDPADGHLDMGTGSVTVSTWVNIDATTGDAQSVTYKGGASPDAGYAMFLSSAGLMNMRAYDGTDAVTSPGTTPSFPTGWVHFVGIIDRANSVMRAYINGAEVATASTTASLDSIDSTFPFTIGDRTGVDPVDGKVDEVRVSAVAHSSDWNYAEYQSEANSFNTFGSEQTAPDSTPSDAWCNDTSGVTCTTSWSVRRAVHIINGASSENLANYPILVKLDSSTIDYSKTQNSGQDLRFVDPADPTTVLPYQIESWDESGTSIVWVKVPKIDVGSNSDYILMYYGNATATDGQDATNVWNDYNIVYHMNESSGALVDSAGTAQNANRSATGVTQTGSGKIGYGQAFAGSASSSYTSTPSPGIPATDLTFGVWVYSNLGTDDTVVAVSDGGASSVNEMRIYYSTGNTEFSYHNRFINTGFSMPAAVWHYITATRTSTTTALYDNGQFVTSLSSANGADFSANCDMLLGTEPDTLCTGTLGNYLTGKMDELRISGTRTPNWIAMDYISQSDAMTTFDDEQYASIPSPTLTAFTGGTSVNPVFQLRGVDPDSPSYLRYKIDVCSNSDCSSIIRTIDQTSSQTGWTGQDSQTSTAYVASATLASSTLASHTYQSPALTAGTTYYWRGYAVDPSGDNTWSAPSAISSFTPSATPAAPTLELPIGGATAPMQPVFNFRSTDPNSDNLRYKIEVCSTSNCSSVIRTIDQTSSQTGWLGQNSASSTAYTSSPTLNLSTQAVHSYQTPALTPGTQYWWRAYAIDPSDTNTWSSASSIESFTVTPNGVRITGGTKVKGGTVINGN